MIVPPWPVGALDRAVDASDGLAIAVLDDVSGAVIEGVHGRRVGGFPQPGHADGTAAGGDRGGEFGRTVDEVLTPVAVMFGPPV